MSRRLLAALCAAALLALPAPTPAAQRVEPVRIAAYGDSIALGVGSTGQQGFRPGLTRHLDTAGIAHQWVGDGARSNWDVQGVYGSVLGWLDIDQPDVVLLMIGTNNAAGACGAPPCAGMTNFTTAYRALIDRMLGWSPTLRIVVGTVMYSNAAWSPNEVTVNVAVITQGMWHPSGRVTGAYTNKVHRCTLTDGVHPGDAGYQWMAGLWATALLPLLGAPAPPRTDPDTDERPGYEMGALSPQCRNMP